MNNMNNTAASNRCRFAAMTFHNIKAARAYEARTGRHAVACSACHNYHA